MIRCLACVLTGFALGQLHSVTGWWWIVSRLCLAP